MIEDAPTVSVIIPVATAGATTRECLRTVLQSLVSFGAAGELVLVLNGVPNADRTELAELLAHPEVTCVERDRRIGSAPARCLGVERARGRYFLFTDADCRVPPDWVERMVKAGEAHGVACGQVQAANARVNVWVRIEQEVDRLRNSALTRRGVRRYPVIANMIARRDLLAPIVAHPDNTTESIQSSVDYGLRGVTIASVDGAAVRTIYPSSLRECLSRRAKHAKGVAFAQRLWGRQVWRRAGMRGPLALALAALVRVWRMRLSRREQAMALALRLCFAAMWAGYLVARVGKPGPRPSSETFGETDSA